MGFNSGFKGLKIYLTLYTYKLDRNTSTASLQGPE